MAPQYLLTLAGSKKQSLNGIMPQFLEDAWDYTTKKTSKGASWLYNKGKDSASWFYDKGKDSASWLYDNALPDVLKVEEYYNFITEKALDTDFWERQYKAIKENPVAFSYDLTSKFMPDVVNEYSEEYVIEPFLGQIEEIVQSYIRANYYSQIDSAIRNNAFLFALPESQLSLGLDKLSHDLESRLGFNSFYSEISNTVAGVAVTGISSIATPAIGALAYYPAYAMSMSFLRQTVRDNLFNLLRNVYKDFFAEQNKKRSEVLNMVNIPEDVLERLVYSSFDFETYQFLEYKLPFDSLDSVLKNAIVNLVNPFGPLLASMNNDEQKSFEKLSDWVFYMLWHKHPSFQTLVANPEKEKEVQTLIAVTIWNKRAYMLNEMLSAAERLTGQGFASRNNQIHKKAKEMKDVLGRWEATKARGEFEAKLAQDRARWASEASHAGVKAQEGKALAEVKKRDNLKKVGTWGLGALALFKLLS